MDEKSSIFTENKKIKYFLGIDGGGTKTEFLLTDFSGKAINRIVSGGSNPVNSGIEKTKDVLVQGINLVCENINPREISAFAGIAGGISGNNRYLINEILSGIGFGAYSNGSDTDSALELALKGENGIVVIMGTGVVAFSQNNLKRRRVAGWGYLIDKGGSGFSFGADALDCAFKAFDGRGGSQIILKLIEEKLQKPINEAIPDIYRNGTDFVASFTPIVFEAFKKGDEKAGEIILKNLEEIEKIICAGDVFSPDEKVKTVFCGGMVKQKDVLQPLLEKHLGERYELVFSEEPLVNGAISLAEGNIC